MAGIRLSPKNGLQKAGPVRAGYKPPKHAVPHCLMFREPHDRGWPSGVCRLLGLLVPPVIPERDSQITWSRRHEEMVLPDFRERHHPRGKKPGLT